MSSIASDYLYIFSTTPPRVLYLYPIILGCGFPTTSSNQRAPFRLLALGDPQLEGDSSLPEQHDGFSARFKRIYGNPELQHASARERPNSAQSELKSFFALDVPLLLRLLRKKIDLFGNDYYLAHIYRTLHTYLEPTHVVVLGDLIGSQWISDEEFSHRGHRYWDRVFNHGQRVEDEITNGQWRTTLESESSWKHRIINVVGNHDIGYAGDMTEERITRFEKMYGKANWDTIFTLSSPKFATGDHPELRLIILNTLNMDVPVLSPSLQSQTYGFINSAIGASSPVEDTTSATILLTHLPSTKTKASALIRQ
ncbi:uncharacterized protein KY384_001305 [Bacidia gigantensis]|uniref:uncharacterized protein n=1 Tax=Bacidia gigantensis TaxID=2732470 RepID=UPI001D041492|nr:uncharacterized protein KY384_001305 [Bacidia gigantensis]KAG8533565.1 hypothetical protein KY384_001305 [Bacidia gigantensis]